MTTAHLSWTGVICCLAALALQLFPGFTDAAGVDVDALWRVFAFGLFLLALSALSARRGGG